VGKSLNSNDLAEILDNLDMEDYLSWAGIDYKRTMGRSGPQLNLKCCPRCGGSTWKVYLNAETGFGNCFHGDCSGEPGFNKFTFIRNTLQDTNTATIKHLEEYAKEIGWKPKRVISVATNNDLDVALPKSLELPFEGRNAQYLEDRGISIEMASYFDLKLCLKGGYKYTQNGEEKWQSYNNRIIIPIYDLSGTLVNFQGRDITGLSPRKYLFPPGLPGTGRFLYNGQNAWGAEHVVINEGAFDVIATKMALDTDPSLRRVVPIGTFGKHLSHGDDGQFSQLMRLKTSGLKKITIMWDSDAVSDAIKEAEELRANGFEVRVALLPGKDPNELPKSDVIRAFKMATLISSKLSGIALVAKLGMLRRQKGVDIV
jgi:DNA primase